MLRKNKYTIIFNELDAKYREKARKRDNFRLTPCLLNSVASLTPTHLLHSARKQHFTGLCILPQNMKERNSSDSAHSFIHSLARSPATAAPTFFLPLLFHHSVWLLRVFCVWLNLWAFSMSIAALHTFFQKNARVFVARSKEKGSEILPTTVKRSMAFQWQRPWK